MAYSLADVANAGDGNGGDVGDDATGDDDEHSSARQISMIKT